MLRARSWVADGSRPAAATASATADVFADRRAAAHCRATSVPASPSRTRSPGRPAPATAPRRSCRRAAAPAPARRRRPGAPAGRPDRRPGRGRGSPVHRTSPPLGRSLRVSALVDRGWLDHRYSAVLRRCSAGLRCRRVLARAVIAPGRHAVDHVGHGCSSWYLGKDGLPELFPWAPSGTPNCYASPEAADFEVSWRAPVSRPAPPVPPPPSTATRRRARPGCAARVMSTGMSPASVIRDRRRYWSS